MQRRQFLQLSSGIALSASVMLAGAQVALAQEVDVNGILYDPEAPVGGNPKGDLTIVVFTDYNCIYCKKSGVDLAKVVKEDGNIRLVYKEWPILTELRFMARNSHWLPIFRGNMNSFIRR